MRGGQDERLVSKAVTKPAFASGKDGQLMISVDTIVHGGIVVTMNAKEEIVADGAVAVREGQVVAVGPAATILSRYEAPEMVDCAGQAIIPGLINAHTHVPMSLLRGLADDLRLDVWLLGYMMPVEREYVGEDFCHWGTLLSCAEMIHSGVTCFRNDNRVDSW